MPFLLFCQTGQVFRRSSGDRRLISCKDILPAYQTLLALDYSPELPLTPQKLARYASHEDKLSFFNSASKVIVELHWDIAGAYLANPLPIEDLKRIPDQFSISGCSMPGIENGNLLVYLCVHGAKHKWERLEWIRSTAVLLHKSPDMDWEAVLLFAEKKQCTRMLFLGLLLAHNLFKAELPAYVLQMIREDTRLAALEADVMEGLFHDRKDGSVALLNKRFSFFHMKVRDTLLDSLRYQLRLFFRPSNVEWALVDIPAPLSFLYFLIRPFRLGFAFFFGA
jgi:hypothetical protein